MGRRHREAPRNGPRRKDVHAPAFDNPPIRTRTGADGGEIWDATAGKVDVFLAGVARADTITGVGEVLKASIPASGIVAWNRRPRSAQRRKPGWHEIQGIGAASSPGA